MNNEPRCPRPASGRPNHFSMDKCIAFGECGCSEAGARVRELSQALESVLTHLSDTDEEGLLEHVEPIMQARKVLANREDS